MFPYIPHPFLDLGFYKLDSFRVLVLSAIVVECWLVVRRAPGQGVDVADASRWITWAVVAGLVGAHVFDALTYFPERVRRNPFEVLRVWGSLSSTGGMLFGILGLVAALAWHRVSRARIVAFLDVVIWALPFTLAVGRLGCALQHDHLGVRTTSFLAVRFPDGPRYDLGLLECLACVGISALFAVLGRRPRRPGFFTALFFALYAPTRFVLDTLRIGDARYLGLTPAQYLCIGAGLLAVGALLRIGLGARVPARA